MSFDMFVLPARGSGSRATGAELRLTCGVCKVDAWHHPGHQIGALPSWPYSSGWGYYPSGGLGLIVVILLILLLMGRI